MLCSVAQSCPTLCGLMDCCLPGFSVHGIFQARILVKVKVIQSCPTLCNPMDYTVHGILQARILEWVAVPFSKGFSNPGIEPRSPTLQVDSSPTEEAQEYWSGQPIPSVSSGSSWPRNWTGISCIAGRLFISWGIREEYQNGLQFPTLGDLPTQRSNLCLLIKTFADIFLTPSTLA